MNARSASAVAGVVVLLAAAVLTVNSHHVMPPDLVGDGDICASGLLIRDAAAGRATHGPYSRLGFHHPGPFVFRILAVTAPLVPGPPAALGRERAATLLLNLACLAAILLATTAATGRDGDAWLLGGALAAAILPIAVTGHHPLLDYWGPLVVILPALACALAAARVARGHLWWAPTLVATGVAAVHTHLALAVVVGPLGIGALGGALWSRRRGALRPPGRRGRVPVALGLVLLVVTSVPVVRGELSADEGNLARMVRYAGERAPAERSAVDVVRATSWAGMNTFTLGVPGLAGAVGLVPTWLAFVLPLLAVVVGVWQYRRAGPDLRVAILAVGAMWPLAVFFAVRAPDNPASVPYVYHFLAGPTAFAVFIALRLPVERLERGRGSWRTWLAPVVGGLLCVVWVARFPVPPAPRDVVPAAVWRALPPLSPDGAAALNVMHEFGGADHALWPQLVALVLAAEQRGWTVRVSPSWTFLFGRHRLGPSMAGASTVLLSVRDLTGCLGPPLGEGNAAGIRVLPPGATFVGLRRLLHACNLAPLPPGQAAVPDGNHLVWQWWRGTQGLADRRHRWNMGTDSSLIFRLGEGWSPDRSHELEIVLGAEGERTLGVELNGRALGELQVGGHEPQRFRVGVPDNVLLGGQGGNELRLWAPGGAADGGDRHSRVMCFYAFELRERDGVLTSEPGSPPR